MTLPRRRRLREIVIAYLQFGLIVVLFAALSSEYQANTNQQLWISQNLSWLQYLLNGYLSAALVGIALGAGFLLVAEIVSRRRRTNALKTTI